MKASILTRFGRKLNTVKDLKTPHINENKPLLIKMLYSPINPADMYFCKGMYEDKKQLPSSPGFEGVGIVEEVSKNFENRFFTPGTIVTGMFFGPNSGCWRQYVTANPSELIAWDLSEEQKAENYLIENLSSCMINPITVIGMMRILEEKNCNSVLQTGACSALGKILLQKCKSKSIPVINIVRRQEQVIELQNLGADPDLC